MLLEYRLNSLNSGKYRPNFVNLSNHSGAVAIILPSRQQECIISIGNLTQGSKGYVMELTLAADSLDCIQKILVIHPHVITRFGGRCRNDRYSCNYFLREKISVND